MRLPIDDVLDDVLCAVRTHRGAVISAPPGSGKTTRIPPALLDVVEGQVWVLQPRRVAARLTAQRIAQERGVAPGTEVGWRVRFDNRSGPDTRLLVVTEGLLTRRLQDDPFLEGIGAVVVDEVHERSLNVDLALALLTDIRRDARPDLVVVAMSATLDASPLGEYLGVPVIRTEGRAFPIETVYTSAPSFGPLSRHVAAAIRTHHDSGSTLVFLPGRRDIERTAAALSGLAVPIFQLHGGMPLAEQQRALQPGGQARVVLSTNLAETSVTVPGVRTVIDSGLVKTLHFDPALGIERLVRERISDASAVQRAGRAGRTGPGRAVRLWGGGERLSPFDTPAIQREDIAGLILQVWAWGTDPEQLSWYEPPSPAHLAVANALLTRLGAVEHGQITATGRALAALPLPPRVGAMLLAGHEHGCLTDAAGAAVLITERDPWSDGIPGAAVADDVLARLPRIGQDRRLRQVRDQLVKTARRTLGGTSDRSATPEQLVRCILAGFPDRLGRRTARGRYRMVFGGAVLSPSSLVEDAPHLIALSVRGAQRGEHAEHQIDLASPVDVAWLDTSARSRVVFNKREGAVFRLHETVYGEHVLAVRSEPATDAELLAAHASASDLAPSRAAQSLLARVNLLITHRPDLGLDPITLDSLLPALCEGRRRLTDLASTDVAAALRSAMDWRIAQCLDTDVPTHLTLPTGTRRTLTYTDDSVTLSVRIQQVFGWTATPRIVRGRVPVTLELLSPANRTVQITTDLNSFWENTWPDVRKELRGRYVKHAWPEDPLTATAEDRPRRRRS